MWPAPLTITSVIVSSFRYGSIGPRPWISASMSSTSRSRSSRVTAKRDWPTTRSTMGSMRSRRSESPIWERELDDFAASARAPRGPRGAGRRARPSAAGAERPSARPRSRGRAQEVGERPRGLLRARRPTLRPRHGRARPARRPPRRRSPRSARARSSTRWSSPHRAPRAHRPPRALRVSRARRARRPPRAPRVSRARRARRARRQPPTAGSPRPRSRSPSLPVRA